MGFTIGIVGLGLIGGSAAKALHAYTEHTLLGADTQEETLRAALSEGVLAGALTPETLPLCDWLLVALYPRDAVAYMRENARRIKPGATVIDMCGVKRRVVQALAPLARQYGFTFLGGHPMAGVARFGYENADKDLFRGASMILTPEEELPGERMAALRGFFGAMGFGFLKLTDAREHDRMIAYTSQLAHVLSSAYVQSPSSLRHVGFSAGSLRDMTRVATLNVPMWTELFMENREYLAEEVEALAGRLAAYAGALRQNDAAGVAQLLASGCAAKRQMEEEEARCANGSHPGIQTV